MDVSTVGGRKHGVPGVKRRITLFLFLLSFVTYLDRVNISMAGVPISRAFGFSNIQLGTIFSAFVLGYTIFQIPAGWLGDRFGHKRLLIGALCGGRSSPRRPDWAGKGFLPRLVGVTASFWIVRFLIGAGESATYPCSNGLIAEWIEPAERGSTTGLMFAGIGAGTAHHSTIDCLDYAALGLGICLLLFQPGGCGAGVGFLSPHSQTLLRRATEGLLTTR